MRGNEEGIAVESGSGNNEVTRNKALLNGFGILVDSNPGTESNSVERNTANNNEQDGIQVGPTTVVKRNTANDNKELGINAAEEVVDRGGNKAAGNGDVRQCVGVRCS